MKTFTLLSIFFCCAVTLYGQIIYVPADQPTIQDGINAAHDGDTVLVADSTYYENINFRGKAITVASHFLINGDTSHISKTIIDGSQPSYPDSASTVYFVSGEDTTSVLCGFTITGGSGTNYLNELGGELYLSGGGIFMISGGKVQNNIIRDNHLNAGYQSWAAGMLIMMGGDPSEKSAIIQDNLFRNNSLTSSAQQSSSGGGIKIGVGNEQTNGILILQNNIISHNVVRNTHANGNAMGGGIMMGYVMPTAPGQYLIRNNIIIDNKVYGKNRARAGGMAIIHIHVSPEYYYDSEPAPLVYNNIIANNYAEQYGGGIVCRITLNANPNYKSDPQPVLMNNTVVGNSSPGPDGDGIYIETNSKPVVFNNILWNEELIPGTFEIRDVNSTVNAYYNCIQGGWGSPEDQNIDSDPLFEEGTYALSSGSCCIGRGIDAIPAENKWYYTPGYDYYGSVRPHPIDNFIDLGAIESPFQSTVGVNTLKADPQINIFPNPANSIIHVETEQSISSVEIFNALGVRLGYEMNVGNRIHLGHLGAGIYLIRITTEKGLAYTAKILKK
jgi:hypothetical protein